MPRVVIAFVLLVLAVVACVVAGRRGWRPDFEPVLRFFTREEPSSELDREHARRRDLLLHRVASAVPALPVPHDGPVWLTVRIHPADAECVGRDVADDEHEINIRLSRQGVPTRVRVAEFVRDKNILRTRVHVSAGGPPKPVTRLATPADLAPPPDRPERPRNARLVVQGPSRQVLTVPAAGGVIGRDASACDLVLDLPTVSRRHVRIRPRSGAFEVEDLGSANGITINSRPTELGVLHDRDVLGLGRGVKLQLELL